jgi:hypothetical protein
MKKREWTPEEDATMREFWNEKSKAWIAMRIKRTESEVQYRGRKIGLSNNSNARCIQKDVTNHFYLHFGFLQPENRPNSSVLNTTYNIIL